MGNCGHFFPRLMADPQRTPDCGKVDDMELWPRHSLNASEGVSSLKAGLNFGNVSGDARQRRPLVLMHGGEWWHGHGMVMALPAVSPPSANPRDPVGK
jgi:hypothetical protein